VEAGDDDDRVGLSSEEQRVREHVQTCPPDVLQDARELERASGDALYGAV